MVLVSLNELSNSNRIVLKQLTIVLKIRNILARKVTFVNLVYTLTWWIQYTQINIYIYIYIYICFFLFDILHLKYRCYFLFEFVDPILDLHTSPFTIFRWIHLHLWL